MRDQILAIKDRSGNPDLIGARILLEMMLSHPWFTLPSIDWSYEEKLLGLPILEALSGAMTGTVRRETRKALATVGINSEELDGSL